MNFLMLIPGLFELLEKLVGPALTSVGKSSIITSIFGGAWDGTAGGLTNIVAGVIGGLQNEKVEEIKAQVASLLAQAQINDKEPEVFFYRGWRPCLAWALSIIVATHLFLLELGNILSMFNITTVGQMAPLDNMTLILLTSLLGIYMGARTVEKVNSNAD